jgi:hypothetical protein
MYKGGRLSHHERIGIAAVEKTPKLSTISSHIAVHFMVDNPTNAAVPKAPNRWASPPWMGG